MATKKKKTKSSKKVKSSTKRKPVTKKKKITKKAAKKKRAPSRTKKTKKTSAKKRTVKKKKTVKTGKVKKKSPRKNTVSNKRTPQKRIVKKKPVKKAGKKKSVAKKRTVRRIQRSAMARTQSSLSTRIAIPRNAALQGTPLGSLNYRSIETEITKLTDLLQTIRKKNVLVKKSIAYLEKEQKKVSKQIQEARKYLGRLKNRGIKALREFPDSAEEIFYQLKAEITRLSKRLGILNRS